MIFPAIIIEGDYQVPLEDILLKLKSKPIKNNPDVFVVNQDTGWGIDVTKSIIHFFSQKSIIQPSKICLIYQAENLTTEAQNAILKTLEEPPSQAHFILITSNHHQLLNTIISRSQLIFSSSHPKTNTPPLSLPKNISQAIDFSTKLQETISKENLSNWFDDQIEIFHRQLLNQSSPKIISNLLRSKQMHRANVEPKAIVDWLYLNLVFH